MFIATLFTIAKTWEQLKCFPVDERINKLCYNQTIEHYSTLKRNELSRHERAWRNLACILLSGRPQCEKATTIYFQPYNILKKAKLWRQ